MIQLEHEGVCWEVLPGFEALVRATSIGTQPAGKPSANGMVTDHEFGQQRYRITHHRGGWLGWFFPSHSPLHREWETAQRLAERDIPLVRRLAFGEGRGGDRFVISEAFDGLPLDEAAARCPDAIYDFFNRLYRSGITLRAPQPEDVLVKSDTSEVRLAGLRGVVMHKEVSEPERLRMLAFVRVFLPLKVPEDVERESESLRKGLQEAKAHRCLEDGAGFELREFGPLRWRVRVAGLTPEAENILRAPNRFLEQSAWLLQNGGGMRVGGTAGLVLKRFEGSRGGRGSGWRGLAPGLRAFCLARHLELAGVPAPRPIAAMERPAPESSKHTFFLMEEIPDVRGLRQWRGDPLMAVRSVAELMGRLHYAGFSHENLKETNIVFDSSGRAHLVGFDGLSYLRNVLPEQARADLERVNQIASRLRPSSGRERVAFLHAYCRVRRVTPGEVLGGPWQVKSLGAVRRQSVVRRP